MVPEEPTVTNTPEPEEVLVVSSSVVVEEPPSLLLLQEYMVRLKRDRERIMSRCFTWFPISGLGKPKLYQNLGCFTRKWGYLETI
jgi:hypothetical protein